MQTPGAVGAGRNSNCGFSPIPGNKGTQESCAGSGIAQTGRVTRANPITTVISGPIGCRTTPLGWPSGRRGTGSVPPAHFDRAEEVKPIEQHGFTLVDFTPDKMVLRFFKWDYKTQAVDQMDTLQPF